ncbi:MAG: hypothetical protein RI885_2421 [Actinomycetota bacterium]
MLGAASGAARSFRAEGPVVVGSGTHRYDSGQRVDEYRCSSRGRTCCGSGHEPDRAEDGPRVIVRWLARIAAARARREVRLLSVVVAVALVSSTALSSLALLVAVAERGGLSSALGRADADATSIDVTVTGPTVSIDDAEQATRGAVESVLDGAVPVEARAFATSGTVMSLGSSNGGTVSTYFAEVDDLLSVASIVEGEWPDDGSTPDAGAVPLVAVPQSVAEALGATIGDSVISGSATVEIAATYRSDDTQASAWASSPLRTNGVDSATGAQDGSGSESEPAGGPFVVGDGLLEATAAAFGVGVQSVGLRFAPDFSTVEIDDVGRLADRLQGARTRVPSLAGDLGERIAYSSRLGGALDDASAGLLVTRSTIVTIALLLLLIAAVSLAQAARLVTDSRFDERRLLLARGASNSSLRGMSALEAGVICGATALVSPLLATLVYGAASTHPSMVAAGMPSGAGLPPLVWIVAASSGLIFLGVLMAPLVRSADLTDDGGDRKAARRARSLGVVRVGIDLAVLVLAALAYQQLVTYSAPTDQSTVRIDPVLVIAPAVLLATCSWLTVRLAPLLARLLETMGSRSPGVVVPLAGWEVGRRADRLTSVVLLLTLALGTGSFGATFLATWRQSQIDQVAFDVGPPARVAADSTVAPVERAALAEGSRGEPSPVLRRVGEVAISSSGATPRGPQTQVLGLDEAARALIARDRNAVEGGSEVSRMLDPEVSQEKGIDLPPDASLLSMDVKIGEPDAQFPGVSSRLSAIVEDSGGLLLTVPLGDVPMDGVAVTVDGALPAEPSAPTVGTLRLVGLVADFTVADREVFVIRDRPTSADVLFGRMSVVAGSDAGLAGQTAEPIDLASIEWSPHTASASSDTPRSIGVREEWDAGLRVTVPEDPGDTRAIYSLAGWSITEAVPLVATTALADLLVARPGARLIVVVDGAEVRGELVGTVSQVPGSRTAPTGVGVDAAGISSIDTASTGEEPAVVVVDQRHLSRALALSGSEGATVDEWWIDVDPATAVAYADLDRADTVRGVIESTQVAVVEQTEGPLSIAIPAALWLVVAGAGALTVTGFAVHTTASLRSRRLEFAQLRAIGLERRALVAVVGAESLLIGMLGIAFGVAIGVLLGSAVAGLVGLSPDGGVPMPSVAVVIPVVVIAALAALAFVVVVSVVIAVAGRQRSADPASILRGAGE